MGRCINLSGQRFGRLIIESKAEERNRSGDILWNCICDCGNTSKVNTESLKSGNTKSCGCINIKHGRRYTKEYHTYRSMKDRCLKEDSHGFSHWGGRGITVCDRWLGYDGPKNFLDDMGICPEGKSLDRIDNNGNYEPSNCRWATNKEQSRNQRSNFNVTIGDDKRCLSEWCEIFGVSLSSVWCRIKKANWATGIALFAPKYAGKSYKFGNAVRNKRTLNALKY
jgi:hypothetical protein